MSKIKNDSIAITDRLAEAYGGPDTDDDLPLGDLGEAFTDRDLAILEFALPHRREPLGKNEEESFDCFMMALLLNAAQLISGECPRADCKAMGICLQPPLKCRRKTIADAYKWQETGLLPPKQD